METGILMTGLVLLALVFSPIIYIHYQKSRKERFIKQHFQQRATALNFVAYHIDFWNQTYAIGLDESRSHLLYLKVSGKTITEEHIALSKSHQAILIKTNKAVEIVLQHKTGTKTVLEFGESNGLETMDEEIALAEKWVSLLHL